MIESNNPEINTAELMVRVRAEVQRLKTAKPSPAPDPPTGLVLGPLDQIRNEIVGVASQARRSNQVRAVVPGFLHPFFRNQGRCNRLLLRAVELQEKQIAALQAIVAQQAEQLGKLQELRLPSLQTEIASQKETLTRLLDQLDSPCQETARPAPKDGGQAPPKSATPLIAKA